MSRLLARVRPSARRSAIVRYDGELLHLDLAAPPTDNRANDELIRFLAETLGVARHRIRLIYGRGAKRKLLEVDVSPDVLREWLDRQKARPLQDRSE